MHRDKQTMLLLTSLCELPSIKMTGYVRVMHAWIDVSVEVPLISASAVPPEQEQKQEPKARRRGGGGGEEERRRRKCRKLERAYFR